jgi:hypothetical protein
MVAFSLASAAAVTTSLRQKEINATAINGYIHFTTPSSCKLVTQMRCYWKCFFGIICSEVFDKDSETTCSAFRTIHELTNKCSLFSNCTYFIPLNIGQTNRLFVL